MRIIFVTPELDDGPGIQIYYLLKYFYKTIKSDNLVLTKHCKKNPDEQETYKTIIIPQEGIKDFAFNFIRIFKLVSKLQSEKKIDLIFSTISSFLPHICVVSRLMNIPLLIKIDNHSLSRGISGEFSFFYMILSKFLVFADIIQVVNHNQMMQLPKRLRKISVLIPQIAEINSNIPEKRMDNHALKPEDVNFIFIGRPTFAKGINVLIDATEILKDSLNLKVIVIGKSDELEHHKSIVEKKGLSSIIEIKGYVPDIKDYFNENSILIFPSLFEGMPNVVFEAMAKKVLVIASEIPGVIEIIKDRENGLLFKPGNSLDLAEKIKFIYNNLEIKNKMENKAFEILNRNFNGKTIVHNIIDSIQKIIIKN